MSKQKFRLMQTFMEIPRSLKNEFSQITNSLDLLKAGLVGSGFPFLYVAVSCVR